MPKSIQMKFGPLLDIRSIGLYAITYAISWFNQPYMLGIVNMKELVEVGGSIAAFSTVAYNMIKSFGEIHKFIIGHKWRKKRKMESKKFQEQHKNDDQLDIDFDKDSFD